MYVIVLHPLDVLRSVIVNQDLQDPEDKIGDHDHLRPGTLSSDLWEWNCVDTWCATLHARVAAPLRRYLHVCACIYGIL